MAAGFIRARIRWTFALAGVFALIAAALALAAGTKVPAAVTHGGVIKVIRVPGLHINANQSTNWFGYDQGSIEQGGKLFNSITADWTVPTATQHTKGEAESSATWIGIGGGCVDAGCDVTDPSGLIQTGTEQDVDSSGKASYSAWWELVPVPSVTIDNMAVSAGDHMHASVAEVVANSDLWTITLQDLTKHETFTTTVPYTSSHASAEWIEETPLMLGTGDSGLAPLPALKETPFSGATVNGEPAGLKSSEELDLFSGTHQIGTPSGPESTGAGFGACAWATSCQAPGTVAAKAKHRSATKHKSKSKHEKKRKKKSKKRAADSRKNTRAR
jgi:hypothetical protein